MKPLREKLSYANVVSTLCLFLLLGGAAVAASKALPKNSVGTKQLKNNSVTTAKIKNGAVTGAKVQVSSLGTVPSATSAASANSATNAANADALGGQPASAYAKPDLVRSATVGESGFVAALSSGITATQFVQPGFGYYCFRKLSPPPTTAVASVLTLDEGADQGATAATKVDPSNAECQVEVDTYDIANNDKNEPFSVIIR
jgi:hypothetical protein